MPKMSDFTTVVTCPFYVRHKFSKRNDNEELVSYISCEGLSKNLGFDITMQHRFKNKVEAKDYIELFCCDRYKECPYFKAVMSQKYS